MTRSVVPFIARKGDLSNMRTKLLFSALLLIPAPLSMAQDASSNKNSWWDTPISAADPQPIAETPLLDDPAPSPFGEEAGIRAEIDATGDVSPAPSPFGPQPIVSPAPQGHPTQGNLLNAPNWNPAVSQPVVSNAGQSRPAANVHGVQNYAYSGDSGIWMPYGPSRPSHTLLYMQCMNVPPCVWEGYAAQRHAEQARLCQYPQGHCRTGHCHNRYLHPHCGQGCGAGACGTGSCQTVNGASTSEVGGCSSCAMAPNAEPSNSGALNPIPASQATEAAPESGPQQDRVAQQPSFQLQAPQYR